MCITDDADLNYRLELIRNHGENVVGPAGYDNITNILGFNYRLTEIQAAIAIEQLKRLDQINEVRIGYVKYLNQILAVYDVFEIMPGRDASISTFYTYPIIFRPEVAGVDIESFHKALNAEGMYFLRGYKPLYLQPIYQRQCVFKHGYPWSAAENQGHSARYEAGTCPVAEKMRERILINEYVRLPHTEIDLDDIIGAIRKIVGPLA